MAKRNDLMTPKDRVKKIKRGGGAAKAGGAGRIGVVGKPAYRGDRVEGKRGMTLRNAKRNEKRAFRNKVGIENDE